MSNIINIENIFGGDVIDLIWRCIKELFNQPRWLRNLVFITIIFGGVYFLWNSNSEQADLDSLRADVEQINSRITENISGDEYRRSLKLIVSELKYIRHSQDQKYNEQVLQLELLTKCVKRIHPNDPLIEEFQMVMNRLKMNHEMEDYYYTYTLEQLDEIIKELENINSQAN